MRVPGMLICMGFAGFAALCWDLPRGARPADLVFSGAVALLASVCYRGLRSRVPVAVAQAGAILILAGVAGLVMGGHLVAPLLLLAGAGLPDLLAASTVVESQRESYATLVAVSAMTLIIAGPDCSTRVPWALGLGLLATLVNGLPAIRGFLERPVQW